MLWKWCGARIANTGVRMILATQAILKASAQILTGWTTTPIQMISAPTENERTVTGMAEYIEREAAIEAIMCEPPDAHYPQWYANKIKAIPSVDVAPVLHARWLPFRVGFWTSVFECSECHRRVTLSCDEVRTFEMLNRRYPFCHCGAKMDGGYGNGEI